MNLNYSKGLMMGSMNLQGMIPKEYGDLCDSFLEIPML
jgi:hypothetical protein